MSISIYSFVNDLSIINTEIKELYDTVQFNEDKLKGKIGKLQLRKLKKKAAKEECSDAEILEFYSNNCKELKKLLLQLDKTIEEHLEYQEGIIKDYNIEILEKLPERILTERKTYEEFIQEYLPVDIRKFISFEEETSKIFYTKMPFDFLPATKIVERVRIYNNKISSLLYTVNKLEARYKIIYQNAQYYDKYIFPYEESKYFEKNGENYGLIGKDYYYKGGELIPKETFEKKKELLVKEVESYDLDNPDWDNYLNNNFSFLTVRLVEQKIALKNIKWDRNLKMLLYKDKIILYVGTAMVVLQDTQFITYRLNQGCKEPVVLEIPTLKDLTKLILVLEESYTLHVMFNQIIAIKGYPQDQIKKKIDLKPIDIEEQNNFEGLESLLETTRTELNYKVYEEIQKLSEGTYWLSIEQSVFKIQEYMEKKNIKIALENKIQDLEKTKVFIYKSKVTLDKKAPIYLMLSKRVLVVTDNRNYQCYTVVNEEEE